MIFSGVSETGKTVLYKVEDKEENENEELIEEPAPLITEEKEEEKTEENN